MTTLPRLLPGRAVPYAVALGMTTTDRMIPVSGRSVSGDVFAAVALPVHRTPGVWVLADRPPVGCGARCALWAVKRGAVVRFGYLHDHDDRGALPTDQRRGDMEAPDGPPRPLGTRTLSFGRRQYTWTTARDVSPIVGRPDSERLPETDDEGLQVALMLDEPHDAQAWTIADRATGLKPPTDGVWVESHQLPSYSRVVVTKYLHTPKAERKANKAPTTYAAKIRF